jgi:protein-S-isoprenylcysteine O-methyltransferase Ste14
VYWLASAWRTSATKIGEKRGYRLVRVCILFLTFMLLLAPWPRGGPLGRRFLADSSVTRGMGLALTLCGLGLAVWARHHLGRYWSDKVELKVDHQFIRSGPYSCMRHPIYSGVLLGVAGTALAAGEWRGLLALLILLANYTVKAGKEERLLETQFGPAFREHKRQTGFLFPRL